ncbi:enoyl-CoA hydratase-related protein [Antarcticirhabdus aurantiaca]|uniref:Enoyl-CoA hydratase-related protein n=1 Tax=Antarcticirhabdus aurantiaca TaxID=2606717 RepID=A0ACD4NMK4_9HYPH|nr:enoyl-CoA hydratase-related protein [Antarcticirhabdus aurantiaca]WAJ28059.1 enoyl-CoA hydratase-related protein [Jeongeuplla avenae]
MSDAVKFTRNGAVAEIVLDRPKANAIDRPTSRALGEVFAAFRDDPELRVAIFTGGGAKFFSAGWDLNEAAATGGDGYVADYGQGGLYGFSELPDLEKPVIAAVNGYAIGAGFEILLCADFVVAADHAAFWLPETSLGVLPDIGSFLLPKLLPKVVANEVLYGGRRFDAADCLRWGLVNAVVPQAELMDAARALAGRILRSAPLSVAAAKQTTRMAQHMSLAEGYAAMRAGDFPLFKRLIDSEDALEGPRAALEKRAPVWKGR